LEIDTSQSCQDHHQDARRKDQARHPLVGGYSFDGKRRSLLAQRELPIQPDFIQQFQEPGDECPCCKRKDQRAEELGGKEIHNISTDEAG
jgi:hypothetical protein